MSNRRHTIFAHNMFDTVIPMTVCPECEALVQDTESAQVDHFDVCPALHA